MKRLFWLICIFVFITPIFAQGAFSEYRWENGNLAFNYPASWEEPVPRFSPDGSRAILLLAQVQAASPETRPPAIPFITITVLRTASFEDDLYAILEAELQAIDIEPIGALPAALFGQEAISSFGTSRDGQLYGIGRIIYLDSEHGAIMIHGRGAAVQRDDFVALFNAIANSLTPNAGQSAIAPQYGVLWQTSRSVVDGEQAFLDIGGLDLADDGTLYLADAVVGLVALDSATGVVKSITAFTDAAEPTAVAVAPDGSVHVADTLCSCIHIFHEGVETSTIDGFGENSPASIAIDANNTLYVSNTIADEYVIDVLGTDFSQTLGFEETPFEAPLLAIDLLGRLVALADGQYVYALQDGQLSLQYELSSLVSATAITVDYQNNLIVATEDDGLLVFDNSGNEIKQLGQVVTGEPQAGELFRPRGLVADARGTIYWADSDGSFGNVTAMSLGVEQNRVGSSNLTSGVEVQGLFDSSIKQQVWTFDAAVGDIVSIAALADESAFDLDVAIHLLDPRGDEIAFVDNDETNILSNPFDALIDNLNLRRDGQYIIIVETVSGTGRYRLGLSKSQVFELGETSVKLTGLLNDVFPVQRWRFQGRGAQTLTITLTSTEGTLDPYLRFLNPQGNLIAENDDAEDTSLGFGSQLLDIRLPINGLYTIEAVHFDGQGSYLLTVENN